MNSSTTVDTLLHRVFDHPLFDRPTGLTASQTHALTHRRFCHVSAAAGPPGELLADRDRLCDLLGLAAIKDPALFHVLLLHYCLCLNGIIAFARDPRPHLDDFAARNAAGVLLMTEAGVSSSHGAIRTEARFDPATRGFVLYTPDAAAIKFPTTAALTEVDRVALVYARLLVGETDCGVFGFVLRFGGALGLPDGMRIGPAPESSGLRADCAGVRLDQVRIEFDDWLPGGAEIDADGAFTDPLGSPEERLRRSMSVGTATWQAIIAAAAGVANAACTMAIRYSLTRVTAGRLAPGRPVIDYRNQQTALFTDLADACALTFLSRHVTREHGGNGADSAWAPWSAVDPKLPLFKAFATETATRIADSARERCGAPAYVGEPLLLSYQTAMQAYRSAGGDNSLIRFDTARAMAAENPVPCDPPTALRSAADLLALARSCEHRLHAELVRRLAAARETAGGDEFAVWNPQLELAAELAGVHAERLAMEVFAEAADEPQLQALLDLHAATWARRRSAALVRCGLLGPGELEAIDDLIAAACDRLYPQAGALVDAYGIDASFLGSFMAADDYLPAFASLLGLED